MFEIQIQREGDEGGWRYHAQAILASLALQIASQTVWGWEERGYTTQEGESRTRILKEGKVWEGENNTCEY
jgi:hypothetical protein